jgi:hypothetical protein
MKNLEFTQMETVNGGGCAGAGSIAVTLGAGALIYATGGAAAWALGGWIAMKTAATINMIEDCTNM